MTQNEEKLRENFEMPPELSAFEAALGEFRPTIDSDRMDRIKMELLLAECRQIEKTLSPEARRERLVETIHLAEKEEISLSLNQYVRQVRMASSLTGGVTGFLLGILLTFIGILLSVHVITQTQPTPPPITERTLRDLSQYLKDPTLYRNDIDPTAGN